MAIRIPVYDQPQVQAQGIPGGMQGLTKSNTAEAIGYLGQAAQIAWQEKEKADTYRAEDAYNKLQERQIQLWSEAQQKQGADAINVHDEYLPKLDEEVNKLAEGGGAWADKFRQIAGRSRIGFSAKLMGHQTNEIESYKKQTALSGINLSFDEAAKNAGTPIADQAINRAAFLAGMEADRQGLKGDAYSEMVLGVTSKGHITNIKGMMETNPMAAKAYLEANKDYITQADADKVRGPLDKMVGESEAVSLADQIEAKFSVRDPKAMDKMARDMVGKDPEKLAALRQELDYRTTKQRMATNEVQGSLIASYIGLDGRQRVSRREIEKSPAYLEMNDADRLELKGKLDTQDERMKGKESRETILNRWAALGELKDKPEVLIAMTPHQLIAMGFDVEQTKTLLTARLGAEGKLSELQNVKVPEADFNRVLEENGLTSKPKTKEGKGEYMKIKSELEAEMRALQSEKKRKLNDDERDALLNEKLKPVRKAGGGFLGFGSSEVRMRDIKDSNEIEATPSERKAVLMRLAAAGLDLNDPYNFKTVLDDERAKAQKGQK